MQSCRNLKGYCRPWASGEKIRRAGITTGNDSVQERQAVACSTLPSVQRLDSSPWIGALYRLIRYPEVLASGHKYSFSFFSGQRDFNEVLPTATLERTYLENAQSLKKIS